MVTSDLNLNKSCIYTNANKGIKPKLKLYYTNTNK